MNKKKEEKEIELPKLMMHVVPERVKNEIVDS